MRDTLNAFDVLADIGGFAEVLLFFGSGVLSLFNYQYMNSLLVSRLYKEDNKEEPSNPKRLKLPRIGFCFEFFIDTFGL